MAIQSALWLLVAITIFGGLRYPLLGFIVPVVMMMGIVGGLLRGRYVCGWLCPRGALYDRLIARLSPGRRIPSWLRSPALRWPALAGLMGFMAFQIALDPGDLYHWGRVFVRICILTTGLGVALALAVHARTWCSFCPIGTLGAALGASKAPLLLDPGCKDCRACERSCPMNLSIVGVAREGRINQPDCIKCPECQLACPRGVLHF